MSVDKKVKTETEEKVKTETEEKVEIPKSQLDKILSDYEKMQNQINLLTKQAATDDRTKTAEGRKREEEDKLLALVAKANEEANEEVEIHIDYGAIKSNKNLDISINGTQIVVPKGKTIRVKKKVAEIVKNAEKQRGIALGLQEKRVQEAEQAEKAGRI